jgi:hypothetical protein
VLALEVPVLEELVLEDPTPKESVLEESGAFHIQDVPVLVETITIDTSLGGVGAHADMVEA